jgi:succinate dehydrogenase / fumarate reductase membrane anchor subunit
MLKSERSSGGGKGEATRHWWLLRLTALALVPLTIWFVVSIVALAGADYSTMVAWVSNPFVSVLLLAMLIALFYHLRLGLNEIIEDYVYGRAAKTTLFVIVTFGCFLLAAASIIAVLKIAIGS